MRRAAANDIFGRLIGQWLSERLGQSFVIENRPGAASNIATAAVVNAPPDGYTLLLVSVSNTINATLYDKLSFNFGRDIAPVAGISRVPNIMAVHQSFPAKTIPEFIVHAKANPRSISMASPGIGTPQHVAGELFNMMTGVSMSSRSISWARTRTDRPAGRSGAGVVRQCARDGRVRKDQQAQGTCGD